MAPSKVTPTAEAVATLERLRGEAKWRKYDSPAHERIKARSWEARALNARKTVC